MIGLILMTRTCKMQNTSICDYFGEYYTSNHQGYYPSVNSLEADIGKNDILLPDKLKRNTSV